MFERAPLRIERIRFRDIVNGRYDVLCRDDSRDAVLRPKQYASAGVALPPSGCPPAMYAQQLPLPPQAFPYSVPSDAQAPRQPASFSVPFFTSAYACQQFYPNHELFDAKTVRIPIFKQ